MGARKVDLVIVGAGAAGTALFIHLFTEEAPPVRSVSFVDPNELAHGFAFSRSETSMLCNTSVAANSLFPGQEDHFLQWIRRNVDSCEACGTDPATISLSSFVPRTLFRTYLQATFHKALQRARSLGVITDHIKSAVGQVHTSESGFVVVPKDGRPISATNVAICTGLGVSSRTAVAVVEAGGLLQSVYAVSSYEAYLGDRPSQIVIFGTRQSAIDAALLVSEARQDSTIVMISPSGMFPSVRTEMREHPATSFTTANLRAALEQKPTQFLNTWRTLLASEAKCYFAADRPLDLTDSYSRRGLPQLRRDLEVASSRRRVWERIDRNAISVANEIWPFMTRHQRHTIREAFGPIIKRYVSAIPASNAKRMLRLQEDERLLVTRGPRRWSVRNGQVEVEDLLGHTYIADFAIDATGFEPFSRPDALRVDGQNLAALHQHVELGEVRIKTSSSSSLFLLGPPLGDSLAVTNYMHATARQASRAARLLAQQPVAAVL